MKQYFFHQWVGISFVHWLIAPLLGIYLATYPLSRWSFHQVATALWFLLFSLILCLWTVYPPIGGSIGLELRRMRRIEFRQRT